MPIYKFNFKDEEGTIVGWNDVTSNNIINARKEAKKMTTEAHWALYSLEEQKYIWVDEYVESDQHCFRMKGTYPDLASLKKQSAEANYNTHLAAQRSMR
tara:strand:+ start:914 stop:1210 length:297 start_codon:yes stop_codon:yes gene_type:complete